VLFLYFLLFLSFDFSEPLAVSNIPEELLEDANAVVRYDKQTAILKSTTSVEIKHEKALTILNRNGAGYGLVSINYVDGMDKIQNLSIEVLDSKGSVIKKIKRKEISDESAFDGYSIASNSRIKYFDYTPNSYPYTIRYSYKRVTKNSFALRHWYPQYGYNLAVQKSLYHLITDIKMLVKQNNIPDENFQIDKKKYSFTATNLPATKKEFLTPSFKENLPYVKIVPQKFHYFGIDGECKNWKEYGQWMYDNMLVGRGQLPQGLISEIDQLLPENSTDIEKAKIIYEFVTQSTRYVSVQLGIGGNMPFKCSEVYDLKYGDCKALSFYTANILEHYGIEAIYTEIHSEKKYNVDYDEHIPSVYDGNHIVLCMPKDGDTTWLECTSNNILFDYTHSGINDRRALLIKPTGGEIVRTQKYSPQENIKSLNYTLSEIDQKVISIKMENSYNNLRYERWISLLTEPRSQWDKKLKSYIYNHIPNLEIESYNLEVDSSAIQVKEQAIFSSTNLIEKAGNYLIVPFDLISIEKPKMIPLIRKSNIYIKDGSSDSVILKIHVPEGYAAIIKEELNDSFNNEFGSIESKVIEKDNVVEINISIVRNNGTFLPTKAIAYTLFSSKVEEILNQKIVFKPTN